MEKNRNKFKGMGKVKKEKGNEGGWVEAANPWEVVCKKVLANELLPTSDVKIGDPAYCIIKADRGAD